MKRLVLTMTMAMALTTTAFAQNRVKNIYASSPTLDMELMQNSEQTVQLNRYFFAGYNTLCLPFSLTADQLAVAAKDLKVERLAAIQQQGETLTLFFVECTSDGIMAGMPYLVYSPTSQYLRVKNSDVLTFDSDIKAVRMSDNNGNVITFGSGWESIEKAGRYGIPAKQDVTPLESILIRTTSDQAFLPTRCGFMWDQQSPSATKIEIKHAAMSDVTAINAITHDNATDAVSYDLQGRQLTKSSKGITIQNGKKVLVK